MKPIDTINTNACVIAFISTPVGYKFELRGKPMQDAYGLDTYTSTLTYPTTKAAQEVAERVGFAMGFQVL